MKKRKEKNRHLSRLNRVERKCDRILSELLILRHQVCRHSDIDNVIDSMHRSARRMRMQAQCECELTKGMLHSFPRNDEC